MTALPPKADINGYGTGCPLLTQSGHFRLSAEPALWPPESGSTAILTRLSEPDMRISLRGRIHARINPCDG